MAIEDTAIGRKIKRLERGIELRDQVIRAYRHVKNNPQDAAAWAAVGSAEAALKFHKEVAVEADILRLLEEIDDGVAI